MSQLLWRIGSDAPGYMADDLSGRGAEKDGGRWNLPGSPVIYAASTRALACLETIVHFNAGGLPLNRYLVQFDVPDDLWRKAETLDVRALPVGWDAEPPGKVSLDAGEAWLKRKASLLLIVPSVIVPEEQNVLINPLHRGAAAVAARKVRKWIYDPRLTKGA